MAVGAVSDPRLDDAFAEIRRKDFLEPSPWQMARFAQLHQKLSNCAIQSHRQEFDLRRLLR